MVTNPKYRENAQLRSTNFRDQKEGPLERAMWWIDYVLRNRDISFLKHPTLPQQSVFVKHSFDIIAFLFALAIAAFVLACKTICWVVKRLRRSKPIKKKFQ